MSERIYYLYETADGDLSVGTSKPGEEPKPWVTRYDDVPEELIESVTGSWKVFAEEREVLERLKNRRM